MSISITLNGKPFQTAAASTISELLHEHSINPLHVVVEVNQHIIPRDEFDTCTVGNDDIVEILRFVGGG